MGKVTEMDNYLLLSEPTPRLQYVSEFQTVMGKVTEMDNYLHACVITVS